MLLKISELFAVSLVVMGDWRRYRRNSRGTRRPHGQGHPYPEGDYDSEGHEDYPPDFPPHEYPDHPGNSDRSTTCTGRDGSRMTCTAGCCLAPSGTVCCTTSNESEDDEAHDLKVKQTAIIVVLAVLSVLIVAVIVMVIVFKTCKTSRARSRRTTPSAIPVKPAAKPYSQHKERQQRQRRSDHTMDRVPAHDVFTVTPVLPSYSDVIKSYDLNRPPPVYSANEPNFGSGYLRSIASPPPSYRATEHNMESRPNSGDRNLRYSSMNFTDV